MTDDIRAHHRPWPDKSPREPHIQQFCSAPGCTQSWPCDAIRMADARDEWAGLCVDLRYERDAAIVSRDKLKEAIVQQTDTIVGLMEAEDRAEADADRLAEALDRLNELAVSMARRNHPREAELQPARIAAQAALAAHEERVR